jgi:hypothetical protein
LQSAEDFLGAGRETVYQPAPAADAAHPTEEGLPMYNRLASRSLHRASSVIGFSALLLAGCAAIEKQETKSTEQLLAAAGFSIQAADTPDKLASLQAMKQHKVLRRQMPGGKLQFLYADAPVCRCLYVGNEQNYQQYQKLAVQQQIAVAQQEAALDESLDSPWAYDWWMPVY